MKLKHRAQIEKFANSSFRNNSQRQDIRNNVKSNISMYLHHKSILARYRTHVPPVIEIKFTNRPRKNAYANPLGDLTYEIGYEDGLLAFFRYFSYWLADQEDAFPKLVPQKRSDFADYMMYCWADLVGFHEWSHIVLGHVGQMGVDSKQRNEIPEERTGFFAAAASRAFEFEADTWGAKFSFARISTITSFLKSHFYGDSSILDIYEDYGFIMFSLLKQLEEFERLEGGHRFSMIDFRRTHPSSVVRMQFMRAGVSEALTLVATAEKLETNKLNRRYWAGVTRARIFYGDGLLKQCAGKIYYCVGQAVYPLFLYFLGKKRLF
jgi:hypothetical protein